MEKSIAMENVSLNCSSRVYRGSDVKGKCSGIKCPGISLAIVNVFRLSYSLLSISLSDLVLGYKNLTLAFIMNRKTRSKTNASGNILTCKRKFFRCPSLIQVLNYHSVLGKVCRCPSNPGIVWTIQCNKLKQVKALKLDCKVIQMIIFH